MAGRFQRRSTEALALSALFVCAACQDNASPNTEQPMSSLARAGSRGQLSLVAINRALALRHAKVRVPYLEYVTTAASGQVGQIIFLSDRGNKQYGIDWVPADPRRGGRTNITYLVDRSDASPDGLTVSQVEAAIGRATDTWEDVRCSKISIDQVPDPGSDPDVFDGQLGFGGIGNPFADITHAGWYPGGFVDLVFGPGASEFILAFQIPFNFTNDDGSPTDINHDGNADFAFSEIYYNDAIAWGINTEFDPIDIETVALHETGHSLGQFHFGKIFGTLANEKLHFAPFSVMNAGGIGTQAHELTGTDIAGHCSLWGSWPNR
jgi:hypothetical protein